MKVAVLLFGHMRSFQYCAPALKRNLLDLYECDVFIHTWDKLESSTLSWWNSGKEECNKRTDQQISLIKKLYNPKKLLIQEQNKTSDDVIISFGKEVSLGGLHNMLDSMFTVFQLYKEYTKESRKGYDLVLFTRPDIYTKSPLDLAPLLKLYSSKELKTKIFTAYNPLNSVVDEKFLTCVDILYFATPEAFDKVFKEKETYFIDLFPGKVIDYGPEKLFLKKWRNSGVSVIYYNYLYKRDFSILRFKNVGKPFKGLCSIKVKGKIFSLRILNNCRVRNIFQLSIHLWKLSFFVSLGYVGDYYGVQSNCR